MSSPSTDHPPAGSASNSASRLFNRDFVLLWQGQLVSRVGSQAFLVALMFWTMEATGSATLMGLLMAASSLPGVLLGPVGGTVADRLPRKSLLVGGDAVRGLAVLGVAWLFTARPDATALLVGVLFGVAVLYGVVGAVFNPAINAALPDLVPSKRLQAGNSLLQLSGQGSSMAGQAVGGVLYAWLGAATLFLVDGISYLLSAASEAWIRLPWRRPADSGAGDSGPGSAGAGQVDEESVDEELKERARRAGPDDAPGYLADTLTGLRFVWNRRGMRTFILTATAINFLAMPVFVLLPFYVTEVLGRGPEWYGFLLAALSGGSVTGLVVAGAMRLEGRRRANVVSALFVGAAAFIGLLGVASSTWSAVAVTFALGVFSGAINVVVMTLLQLAAPSDMRGRVLGLVIAMTSAASPLGMAAGGVVGDLTGRSVPAVFVGAGTLSVLSVGWGVTREGFRAFLEAGYGEG